MESHRTPSPSPPEASQLDYHFYILGFCCVEFEGSQVETLIGRQRHLGFCHFFLQTRKLQSLQCYPYQMILDGHRVVCTGSAFQQPTIHY